MTVKWTIHELKKKVYSDNEIDVSVDLSSFVTEDFNDIKKISSTQVTGYFFYEEEEDIYTFSLDIQTTLTMLCSITLKEVDVALDFHSDIIFSETTEDDDIHKIDGITIDLLPYVFSEIVTEKPMKVVSEDAYEDFDEEQETLTEEEIVENSPFAKLKK
jgi:uncharacterized protein